MGNYRSIMVAAVDHDGGISFWCTSEIRDMAFMRMHAERMMFKFANGEVVEAK